MSKFEELLVNKGFYDSIDVTIDDLEEMEKLLFGGIYNGYNIDWFCVDCNEKRIFESVDKQVHEEHGFVRIAIDSNGTNTKKPKREIVFQQY